MATAKKLPSGNYRVLAYIDTTDGKRNYKSFTASTKKEAEYQAALYKVRKKRVSSSLTVGEAIDRYIDSRAAVLSPKTVREYKGTRKRAFQSLMNVRIDSLTDEQIQRAVSDYSVGRAFRTVSDALVLLKCSVSLFKPDFKVSVTLPQKNRQPFVVPSDSAVKSILNASTGDLRIVILLSAVLGMRRSEICALTWDDIGKDSIRINKAIVQNEHKEWVIKATKTTSGTRTLLAPKFLLDEVNQLPRIGRRILSINPANASNQFMRFAKRHNFVGRLHDLRHFFASTLLEMGVPDLYSMERMGHASTRMLKQVYQHIKADKDKEIDNAIDKKMGELFGS